MKGFYKQSNTTKNINNTTGRSVQKIPTIDSGSISNIIAFPSLSFPFLIAFIVTVPY